jgi:hypothetical protein
MRRFWEFDPTLTRPIRIASRRLCEGWLPVCFIHRVKQVRSFLFVLRFEAALLGGAVFQAAETAVVAAVGSVFKLHVHLRVKEIARAKVAALPSSQGVLAELARILASSGRCWQIRWQMGFATGYRAE